MSQHDHRRSIHSRIVSGMSGSAVGMIQLRRALMVLLALAPVAYFAFDLGRFVDLQILKDGQAIIGHFRAQHPALSVVAFFCVYVLTAALSIPCTTLLTLAGGAIFGLLWGAVIVSFASSIGGTAAFLVSRFLLRGWVARHFGRRLAAIDAGVRREGAFYLFSVRLVPVFPFFLVNLLFGLTDMRVRCFYWVSQLGMLASTLVYVNAGTQLARLASPADVLSPGLLVSFALLGIFPLIARRLMEAVRRLQVFQGWK